MGGIGEIHIGGIQVGRGYFNRDQLTAEKFITDTFRNTQSLITDHSSKMYKTGDLGRWLPHGNIDYLGRIDEQVKLRGYRIELGEIESVILESGMVKQAVALIRTDSNDNKHLVAYVVQEGSFDKQSMISYLLNKLPEYMVPAIWIEIESIPLTPNGKVNRKALPGLADIDLATREYKAPRNKTERDLAEIWQRVLGIERVGIHDNFFELGGDSIITIQVGSQARLLGYTLQPKDIFVYQTIERLSASLSQRTETEVLNERGILTGAARLLPFQQWYLDKNSPEISHFNQSILLGIDKRINNKILSFALEQLLLHHDALRFKYSKTENEWRQEYGDFYSELFTEDLQSAPVDSMGTLLSEYADKYQRSLDIEKGDLVRMAWLQMPESETHNRLLIVIHHLAVDGVSWRILLQDMERLLDGLTSGAEVNLGQKSSSYRQWCNTLEEYGQSKKLLAQKPYWDKVLASYGPLPVDKKYEDEVTIRNISNYKIKLGAENTRQLLQETSLVYGTEINDLLLAALAITLNNWSKNDKVTIGLEGHGREALSKEIDTSLTVGWFTSLYPVLLQVDADIEAGSLIKTVKEQLRRIPGKGLGYGVLKYINKETSIKPNENWDIVFNYLGQFDHVIRGSKWFIDAGESTGNNISEEYPVTEKISVNGFVKAGELQLEWNFSNLHYEEETIKTISEDYQANLLQLIAHCVTAKSVSQNNPTPSDYGLGAEINYQELDLFLNESSDNGIPRKEEIEGLYRLSGLQQGMLFHSIYDGEVGAYIEQFTCDLINPNIDFFTRSWEQVIKNHSILRSAFYYDRFAIPVQCVSINAGLPPVEILDYREMDEDLKAKAVSEYELADRNKPFDFQTAPLMRIALIRLGDDRYRMLWTSHHILFDGWSLAILMEEFLSIYETYSSGKELKNEVEDNYEDYIRYIEQSDNDELESYWRNYLSGVEQGTLLPFISTTSGRTKGAGIYKTTNLQLDAENSSEIQQYARQHRLTVNTIMQGVWSYMLHKYTGSKDIVYGTIVSGRPDDLSNVERRVGLFINTQPLRSVMHEEENVNSWLENLQSAQVASRQFQYAPLQEIQKWSGVEGDLFDSLLIFENYPVNEIVASGKWSLAVENVRVNEQTNFPLTITIVSTDKINITFNYNSDLLDEKYVKRICEHFEHVLLQITSKESLSNISLLTPAEEQQLLVDFNDTGAGSKHSANNHFIKLFEEQATLNPDALAIAFGNAELTFKELNARANQVAIF